ncbi:MAG: GNAT family N-acetyltransferase [Deltaproteobacteria bacterium]|nr:GNAT family N-acetyltransferase [Deltaproteobacteria bacterium]
MNGDAIRRGDTPRVNLSSLSCVLIEDPARLEGMAGEWADLLARSSTNEITLHPEWMLPWWEIFGPTGKRQLKVLTIRDEGRLVGLVPLLSRPHTYRPGIPFKRLETLASGEDEQDESCSEYLSIIAEKGREAEIVQAFVKALWSGDLGEWDELVIPGMNGDSPLPKLLEKELSERGLHVTLEHRETAPYVTLPQSFDAYLGTYLKGNKRSQLKKSLRALESWAGGAPIFEHVRTPAQLAEGKRILEALHRERWPEGGVYRSAKFRAFHDLVMPRLLGIGALDVGWMTVKGQPVSAYYNLSWNGHIWHYQSGRKLDAPDDARVGVTMHALLIKRAIDEGMREYDFLAGVSQYKTSLASETRSLLTLRAARPSVVESARRAAEQGVAQAKKVRDFAKAKLGKGDPNANEAEASGAAKTPTGPKPKVARALDKKAKAFFFGPERALFGWYHPPKGAAADASARTAGGGRAVVLCPPLGYEGICAYPALRIFAERLSAAGHPVLRFDYDGTGDSAGLDSDPDRVRAWVESVKHAVDEVRAQSGAAEVCLFGIRMGATIAATAAADRGDVARVVLWNPCASGRLYAREMKMFRQFAEQTGELAARPRPEGDTSEESGGFLLTGETLDALKKLDLAKQEKRVAESVLVIGRDDVPDDDKVARALEAKGAAAKYEKIGGYAEMMVAPHKSIFPEAVYGAMREWLDETTHDAPARAAGAPSPTARAQGTVAPGVREEAMRFGADGMYFGVLTEPVDATLAKGKPLVVFTNTAGNYRIGPNRMYVEMGRKLAALGIPSFRIDVSGIGDSVIWEGEWENHPYGDQLTLDVREAIKHLKATKRAETFGVAGLCSGAFVGYHSALADDAIVSVVMINPQTFVWEDGMSLEVNPLANRDQTEYYKRRLFAKEAWMKLLEGGVDPRHAASALKGRVVDVTRATIAKVKSKIPIDPAKGSDVARALDALTKRGVDVLFVFAGGDPGIDNLNENVGTAMKALTKRPNFTIETIEGPDHSFTPLWAQEDLDRVLVGHLSKAFSAR